MFISPDQISDHILISFGINFLKNINLKKMQT